MVATGPGRSETDQATARSLPLGVRQPYPAAMSRSASRSPLRRPSALALTLLAAASLTFAACGDDDGADVRNVGGDGGSGSVSGSGSGSVSGSGSASEPASGTETTAPTETTAGG